MYRQKKWNRTFFPNLLSCVFILSSVFMCDIRLKCLEFGLLIKLIRFYSNRKQFNSLSLESIDIYSRGPEIFLYSLDRKLCVSISVQVQSSFNIRFSYIEFISPFFSSLSNSISFVLISLHYTDYISLLTPKIFRAKFNLFRPESVSLVEIVLIPCNEAFIHILVRQYYDNTKCNQEIPSISWSAP